MTRFTGTLAMVRLLLRLDRVRLPLWLVGLVGLSAYSVVAVQEVYNTPKAIASYSATIGASTAAVAFSGPPAALDTIGGITVYEVSQSLIIGIALMAVFLTVRHTRDDEEEGRTELLRAGELGRQADLLAAVLVVAAASGIVGLVTALSMVAVGLAAVDSLLFGAAITCVGLMFMAVALVAAQVARHARGAIGLSLAVLGVTFVVRAAGDVADNGLSWASPIGWAQRVGAFGDRRWWPLALCLLLTVLLGLLATWLTTQRDFGAGLTSERAGPPEASGWLGSPLGLALRLERGMVVSWTLGMAALGLMFGSLSGDVGDLVENNPTFAEFLARKGVDIVDAYTATVLLIAVLTASGFSLAAVLRLRTEEAALRTEPVLATPTSRPAWCAAWLTTTAGGTALVLLATGLGGGIASATALSDSSQVAANVAGSMVYLPAVLLLAAVVFALFGIAPRLAAPAAWILLAACFVIGYLGDLLELPTWLVDLSPYSRTPAVPEQAMDWAPLLAMSALALVLVAAGLVAFRRRDLRTG